MLDQFLGSVEVLTAFDPGISHVVERLGVLRIVFENLGHIEERLVDLFMDPIENAELVERFDIGRVFDEHRFEERHAPL